MNDYDGLEPLEDKETTEQRLSIQERATREITEDRGIGFMLLAQTGMLAPPWWSERRDIYLGRTWQECPLFAGALYNISAKLATIPPYVEPRDPSSKEQRDAAEDAMIKLYESTEFGRGWLEFSQLWYQDRWCADNGAFAEILGAGPKDGPIIGGPAGIANLDSQRCRRTGNPEFPVVYTQQKTAKKFKLHHSRVMYSSQMPSTRDEMNRVGLCWFSRALSFVQSIIDDLTYKQEKMGRRPPRAILVGKKMSVSQITTAFKMAHEGSDNAGLARMSLLPAIANETAADVGIDLVDLASLPDGFDWETDVTLAMYAIALTGGFPVRWLWPATAAGATKADALLQHMATAMSGAAYELGTLSLLLGGSERGMYHKTGKFLPPYLKMRFDVQDDWMDQVKAEIQNTRAQKRERDITDGAVTIRVTREQMLQEGEITAAQFSQMELEDGRTQGGLPVDTLFYTGTNPYLSGIDPDDYTEEEVNTKLKEAKRASVLEQNQDKRTQAKEAVAALTWLLEGDEEEEAPETDSVGFTHDDAPVRGAPREMSSTGPTESASAMSQKERMAIEEAMQKEIDRVFAEYQPQFEQAIKDGEEPDYDGLRDALIAILVTYLFRAFMDEAEALQNEYDVFFDPVELAAVGQQWASSYATQEAGRLMNSTRERTIVPTAAAWEAGELTEEQLSERVDKAFDDSRAGLITITLITVALSMAFDTYRDLLNALLAPLGWRVEEFWVTREDEKVCKTICWPLHEQPREVWAAQYPSGPPAHGRCRCKRRLQLVRIE